jgi:hypothetical protein
MKRGLLLLPLLALLLLPTACGGSDSDVLSLDPVASAASLTTDAGSARMGFSMTMKADARTMKLDGAGLFDFDDSRGTLTMDASSLLPAGVGGDGRFELRMLGSIIYMKLPAALGGQAMGGGKPWIAVDVQKTLKAAGLGDINPANLQQDPTQTLRLLRASSTNVKEAGTAKVRGVQTTRYTAKLDLTKSIEATGDQLGLSEKERAQLRRAAELLSTQSGLKTIPIQIFVDQEGLLRRMSMTMKSTIAAAPFAITQTTDFYDFGVDVHVEAPPESQVFDLSNLIP